jgi:hypothetical protein
VEKVKKMKSDVQCCANAAQTKVIQVNIFKTKRNNYIHVLCKFTESRKLKPTPKQVREGILVTVLVIHCV